MTARERMYILSANTSPRNTPSPYPGTSPLFKKSPKLLKTHLSLRNLPALHALPSGTT